MKFVSFVSYSEGVYCILYEIRSSIKDVIDAKIIWRKKLTTAVLFPSRVTINGQFLFVYLFYFIFVID